ncbi:adhesion G-protein coupled receptor G1 [Rhineura floridana]|uniref:adhesion G-protein coupled receptor G1 n=1 Tax=Rhineura floridana TaxID=261503 RepID=UPI002AC8884E|nr:adhesion G-protein coupled receptor G1 [Rhineura floridana]XP_061450020.1 adhesion G-protein coupled receptor G1 [Rhineura floridana]XP_061450021.1 adhesion G-protein coupled receptor G1 [Rhineura floridana]XP_061450023.1 adhesion G-protein coupled receptor G1 [Rhineura floridana]
MLFFLLPLLFQLQGICGISKDEEDFRFCADRNQTKEGHIRYEIQRGNISIVNSVDELVLRAPFPPEHQSGGSAESIVLPLPDVLGSYRFCLYWFQNSSRFVLTYGKNDHTLSSQANYSLYSPNIIGTSFETSPDVLYNVSYAFDKGFHNKSLPSTSEYNFIFTDSGKRGLPRRTPTQVRDMEEEVRSVEEKLKQLEDAMRKSRNSRRGSRGNPFEFLQHLELKLREVEFQGRNKSFGKGALLHASVWNLPSQSHQVIPFGLKLEGDKEVRGFEVTLPKAVFAKSNRGRNAGGTRAVLLAVSSPTLFQDPNSSVQILGGKVIGISVGNTSVHGLRPEERVALTFWHNRLLSNATPQCVFWDTNSEAGKWNSSGCEVERGEDQITCLCDHLTFFAVLMVSSPDMDRSHQIYLTMITYVGCIISALASLVTIFFLCARKKQRDHIVYVHMNLLWAIFLLDMSFLIAVPLAPAGGNIACKAGAMFLHFSVLACLTWMGIEGYSLYQLVIEVFRPYVKYFLFKLCLLGWGLPIFIVLLIFVIDQSHYGASPFKVYESSGGYTNATICWITKKEINNFLNLSFLSLVLFFNTIMLAAMVREILKLRHRENHWGYAVMLLGLSCVLGIPWGMVFFAFTSGTFKLVAVYLFTIINSLQGFLIFLWYLAKVWQSRRSSSLQCTTTYSNSNSIRLQSNI